MSETRFTPGPWEVGSDGYIVTEDQTTLICQIFSKRNAKANAHLIASAPDLYEACQALDELDCCEGYTLPRDDYPKLWKALELARAALARATREAGEEEIRG